MATSEPDGEPDLWRNVQIVGGGYVSGIVFNESEPGLVYARTDVGGARRWKRVSRITSGRSRRSSNSLARRGMPLLLVSAPNRGPKESSS